MKNNNIKITVSIASIPDREKGLKASIKSLINQVDYINVYLNNYSYVPDFLKNSKINYFKSQNYRDLGDIGKFYFSDNINGYHFTCDDDIIYPSNYVEFMISKLKLHGGFISCHGAIFNFPFKSFYKSKTNFHFRKNNECDVCVNLVGTGVMAYDAREIKIPLKIFKHKNMADIFIAIFAKKNNIKCTVVEHDEFFLKDFYIENLSKSFLIRLFQKIKNKLRLNNIYKKYKTNHEIQTELVNDNKPWDIID